jgi:hypothetical protein
MLVAIISSGSAAARDADRDSLAALPPDGPNSSSFVAERSIDDDAAWRIPGEILAAATELDRSHEGVSLQWDGESQQLTAWVDQDADIDAVRTAALELSAQVQIENAPYTTADLRAVTDRVLAEGTFAGADVQWAGPAPDRSGVDIGVDRAIPQSRMPATVDGIPVATVVDGSAAPASRDLDSAPFSAGAVISRALGNGWAQRCTSAFSIGSLRNGTYENQLLTAEHCGREGGTTTWRTGMYTNSPVVGEQIYGGTDTDIMKLRGQSYGPYMYYGPMGSSTAVAVKGHAAPFAGMYIHHSGASSGVAYNSVVTHTGLSVN